MKAVILDYATLGDGIDIELIKQQCDELKQYPSTNEQQLLEHIGNAEIVITNKVKLSKQQLAQTQIKLICVAATGTNNIDLIGARELGITVANVSGYGSNTVAQHALTLMLMLATNAHKYDQAVKQGRWAQANMFCMLDYPIFELQGKTLAIVGPGAISAKLQQAALALGMKILIAERKGTSAVREGRIAFNEAIEKADVISIHCPLTPETANLFSMNEFRLMKKQAFIINTARGGIINEQDLVTALQQGLIAGAATDVLVTEPPRSDDFMTSTPVNLIVTPHTAWASIEARQTLVNEIAENIQAFYQDQRRNVVN
ncbi:D-2-hydroxyacid dehydrogenase [Paraferrimonas sp. SM1919]|uniref:D-2-hydroxyacid dehydrogenase n=1 Tax=Paraferrimonas sp. SM1919 TaxID=2662263 RepID=UPI0013D0A58E|nr:D-2-hydroxyacid dehydrogenase [Paraferrimonas sp. SM1919]